MACAQVMFELYQNPVDEGESFHYVNQFERKWRSQVDKEVSILDNSYMLNIEGAPRLPQHNSSILLWWFWRGILPRPFLTIFYSLFNVFYILIMNNKIKQVIYKITMEGVLSTCSESVSIRALSI